MNSLFLCLREVQFYSPGASFYGSGYIMQDMEKFSMLGDFDIQMEFRSFKKNGTVLAVQDSRKVRDVCLHMLPLLLFHCSFIYFLNNVLPKVLRPTAKPREF